MRWALAALVVLCSLGGCTVEQTIRWAFAHEGAPGHVQDEAVEVAECESSLEPGARNGPNVGLFQLRWDYHQHYWPGGEPMDPLVNATVAARLQRDQGWRPWACRP